MDVINSEGPRISDVSVLGTLALPGDPVALRFAEFVGDTESREDQTRN